MTLELDRTDDTRDHDQAATISTHAPRSRWRRVSLGAITAVVVAAAMWSGWGWHDTAGELSSLRRQQTDIDRAAAVAKQYAIKSLTYDFNHLDGFFDSVRADTTETLADRYNTVHDTLSKIMTEAQVVARGEVVATSVAPGDDGAYTVTVFATQTTQNVQHPDPITASTLLTVIVRKAEGRWLVSDYHAR